MKELVTVKNDEVVCDSLHIAEHFEKRHDRVLMAIDNLVESLPPKWGTEYVQTWKQNCE